MTMRPHEEIALDFLKDGNLFQAELWAKGRDTPLAETVSTLAARLDTADPDSPYHECCSCAEVEEPDWSECPECELRTLDNETCSACYNMDSVIDELEEIAGGVGVPALTVEKLQKAIQKLVDLTHVCEPA